MSSAVVMDQAELIKWWDLLDMWEKVDFATQLQAARECRHPDAQWLASLFPDGVETPRDAYSVAREVILQQGDDPRALHLAWELGRVVPGSEALLRRAGEMGYAPAQAAMSGLTFGDESFRWAEGAWSRGNRLGMFRLARCYIDGRGCAKDRDRGVELCRAAAELGCAAAQYYYAYLAFGKFDWERFLWFGRAVSKGFFLSEFRDAVLALLPRFANGELSRVLHIVAPLASGNRLLAQRRLYGKELAEEQEAIKKLERVAELYAPMLDRARRAVACWCIVGRRIGMVKDIRVLIGKMAWDEPWRWSGKAS
jgi:TPR repeat protein